MKQEIEQALRTQNIGSLDEIEVGHWVIITSGGVYARIDIGLVSRVTNTQIIIGDVKYNRQTGFRIGDKSSFGKERININDIEKSIRLIKVDRIRRIGRAIDTQIQNIGSIQKEASDEHVNELLSSLKKVSSILTEMQKAGE